MATRRNAWWRHLKPSIHPTADVSKDAQIGDGTRIWHEAQIREGARVGRECNLGKGVYVDKDVIIGDRCKIQNRASVFHGVTLEDGVFVGPHAILANDRFPRAINTDGTLKTEDDWMIEPSLIREGASIGAGAIVLPGITVGQWAMIGAGSVVTANVEDHAIMRGNPARLAGWVCVCGRPLRMSETNMWHCDRCDRPYHFADVVS